MLRQWRHVHNVIVPPDELSLDEVRERRGRHQLRNAYLGDSLVGCSTVRPPQGDEGVATVIARVLGAREIRTVILAANGDGLRFAEKRGFVEVDRYVAPEDENEVWLTLRRAGFEVSGA